MNLILVLIAYFVAAAILGLGATQLRRSALTIALIPFLVHGAVIVGSATGVRTGPEFERLQWVPALGLNLDFRLDGVTLLLSALVASIGGLIVVYSFFYFGAGGRLTRFLALMTLFTGGMAGIVVSDDLFGLFVFWEVTTAASYLLIGFDHERAAARASALQAALVTTLGGLAMLAGFVVLAIEAGTTSITALAASPPQGTATNIALLLVFLGAFTKSAQVPFHFWLPGAMAAPTPASAYLHSATMVKAGIVLLALFAPAFAEATVWSSVIVPVGLATMVVGGLGAIVQRDLKLLLAYSTVSQLGFITTLIGLDLIAAAIGVLAGHAVFKAGLFLVVGVIDKKFGTRRIDELAGVRRGAPVLAIVGGVLAMSMAGVPPLLGFATKEGAFDALVAGEQWLVLAAMAGASVITVVYSARFWWGAFGDSAESGPRPLGRIAAVPLVLAVASLAVGLFPNWLSPIIENGSGQKVKLVLWPGFTVALGVSVAVLLVGAFASIWFERARPQLAGPPVTATSVYAAALRGLNRLADTSTGIVQNGSLPVYLAVILTTVVATPLVVWFVNWEGAPALPLANNPAELVLGAIAVVAAVAATRAKRRLAAVLMLGTVGFSVAGIYVMFGAPDLAMTQVLAETLTVALFALVLVKLPRQFGVEPSSLSSRLRIGVALLVGFFAATAAIVISAADADRDIAAAYIERAPEAGGKNVVNVILTNFRALDTLGEITVLAAAALGVSALVRAGRREADQS